MANPRRRAQDAIPVARPSRGTSSFGAELSSRNMKSNSVPPAQVWTWTISQSQKIWPSSVTAPINTDKWPAARPVTRKRPTPLQSKSLKEAEERGLRD